MADGTRPDSPLRSGSNSPTARQQHDTPKEVSSKFVNAHNTHSLSLPKEVNDKINAARERAQLEEEKQQQQTQTNTSS